MPRPKSTGFLTKFEVCIHSNKKERNLQFTKDYATTDYSGWGWKSMLNISELFSKSNEYLSNGTLTFGAKVIFKVY